MSGRRVSGVALMELSERCKNEKEFKEVKCPLSGYDFLSHFGIGPGPNIGKKAESFDGGYYS